MFKNYSFTLSPLINCAKYLTKNQKKVQFGHFIRRNYTEKEIIPSMLVKMSPEGFGCSVRCVFRSYLLFRHLQSILKKKPKKEEGGEEISLLILAFFDWNRYPNQKN